MTTTDYSHCTDDTLLDLRRKLIHAYGHKQDVIANNKPNSSQATRASNEAREINARLAAVETEILKRRQRHAQLSNASNLAPAGFANEANI